MTEFVLVSCSKSKLDGVHKARDLYEPSSIFQKRCSFARERGDYMGVLSAKHGYLPSWQAIEDYEQHISERTGIWGAFVLCDLLRDLDYYDVEIVTILAGSRYVEPLVCELEAHGYDVVDYNSGLMPGERMAALDEAVATGTQVTLDGVEEPAQRRAASGRATDEDKTREPEA